MHPFMVSRRSVCTILALASAFGTRAARSQPSAWMWIGAVWFAPLVCAAQAPTIGSELDVRSDNRRFVAQVRRVEIGKPDPDRPRHELAVFTERADGTLGKQWSAPYVPRTSKSRYLLTDDGSTFIRIRESMGPDGPLVEVIVKGLPLVALNADKLELRAADRSAAAGAKTEGDWLAQDTVAVRIRPAGELNSNACLDLLARDGRVRTVDLVTGSLNIGHDLGEPAVGPPPAPDFKLSSARACVDRWSAPPIVLEDEACAVQVHGNFPTPGWVLVGFGLKAPKPTELVIVPCVSPPPSGTIGAQVVVGFDSTAVISGLAPGTYWLSVETCPDAEASAARSLEVLPADLLASLKSSGGITGSTRSVAVFWDARAETAGKDGGERRVFLAPPEAMTELARGLHKIGPERAATRTGAGADLITYELTWVERADASVSKIRRLVRDDVTLEPELREIVAWLSALKPVPPLRRYAVDVHASTIAVHTASSGLLSAFGHDHELMVQKLAGEVWAHPGDWARATLFLEIDASSLAVVDNDSQKDRAEIESEMNAKVLESARFPRITFASRSIAVRRASGTTVELSIRGDLTLHGATREVELPVRVELEGGVLRAQGEISLRQSDFRIRATAAAAGTVKVDDIVKLGFDVTARVQ